MTGRDDAADQGDPTRRAREDADWDRIVESYGDRPNFPEPVQVRPEPDSDPVFEIPAELAAADWAEADRYVPPPPPPVPVPHGARLLAWFGLFGVPTMVLVFLMVGISLPSYLDLLLLAWFVGGFGYLVATMNGPRDPDSGWDDGAVL